MVRDCSQDLMPTGTSQFSLLSAMMTIQLNFPTASFQTSRITSKLPVSNRLWPRLDPKSCPSTEAVVADPGQNHLRDTLATACQCGPFLSLIYFTYIVFDCWKQFCSKEQLWKEWSKQKKRRVSDAWEQNAGTNALSRKQSFYVFGSSGFILCFPSS